MHKLLRRMLYTWTWIVVDMHGPWSVRGFNEKVFPSGMISVGAVSDAAPQTVCHALRKAFHFKKLNWQY